MIFTKEVMRKMTVYTLKEAARVSKIGEATLRRACEQGLIKAVRMPNGQYRVTEAALMEALSSGIEMPQVPKRESKQPQPRGLREYAERRKREKEHTK
jgi:excisionase family DNA binding protein